MKEVQRRYIEKLEQRKSEAYINTGIEVCNRVYEEQIVRNNKFNSPVLYSFKTATFRYIDKYFNLKEAKILKEFVTEKLESIPGKFDFSYNKKFRILKSMLINSITYVYDVEHSKRIKYNIEYYKLNQLYKEITDIVNEDGKLYFTQFDELAKTINDFGFPIDDLIEIILEFIKMNIKRYENLSNLTLPYYTENIRNYDFIYISKKEIDKISKTDSYQTITLDDSDKNKLRREELSNLICKINIIKRLCERIYKYYICEDEHSEKSIELLYNSLIELQIEPKICKKILNNLKKKLKKSNQNIQNSPIKNIEIAKTTPSKKQTVLISKEMETYFDFKLMKPTRTLSLNEIIYCVGLLTKTSADVKTIDDFLLLSLKELRKNNPIFVYTNLYNKLIYFKDKYDITSILNSIQQDLEKMFICSDKEYEQIKLNVAENIKYALNMIGEDYEYEKIQSAKIKSINNKN